MSPARLLVLLLAVAVATAANVAPLLNMQNPNIVNGSYIVVLKDGMAVTDRDAHIRALQAAILAAGDVESTVTFRYAVGSMMGFAARLSDVILKQELLSADVEYVEADQVMSINFEVSDAAATVTQTGATWGLDRIDQRALPLNGNYVYPASAGSGVDVYVIDTGIHTTHVDFGGRAKSVFNAFTTESGDDLNGHGTHCAGTIGGTTYGVAKSVNLFAVKVLSASGSGTTAGVVAGVDFVTNNRRANPTVASMSLGGGKSAALDLAVANSIASGIPYSVAAGNENRDACLVSPANVPTAVTVGATTNTDARAYYSNWGTCVDIFAPGTDINSDWIGSNTATRIISGTSMATPHVAGVIALSLAANPGQSPAAISAYLSSTATPNVVTDPRTGSPNLLLYSSP